MVEGPEDWIVIGRVLKPHGLKGEIKVHLLTDYPERFEKGKRVTLKDIEPLPYLILDSRIEGDFAFLKLERIESIEDTAGLLGKEFIISADQLIQPGEDSYYPFQIIGLDVFTEENQHIGILSEIYMNPNQSIYEIKSGKKEHLIPATKNFIKKIDLVGKKIIVHVIEGMLE